MAWLACATGEPCRLVPAGVNCCASWLSCCSVDGLVSKNLFWSWIRPLMAAPACVSAWSTPLTTWPERPAPHHHHPLPGQQPVQQLRRDRLRELVIAVDLPG